MGTVAAVFVILIFLAFWNAGIFGGIVVALLLAVLVVLVAIAEGRKIL
jgi:hypothetical protein